MKSGLTAWVALGVGLLGACSEAPPQIEGAQPAPLLRADGLRAGVKRHIGGGGPFVTPACNKPKLSYFSGPIVQRPIIVAVFWNSDVETERQQKMPQFYADVTQSTYWAWLQEYDTAGLSSGTQQVILGGTSAGGFVIAPAKCGAASGANCKLTDTDLQTELSRQIGLGVLPAPQVDCTGNVQTIYMVDFPANISLSGQGLGKSCVAFCAYHNTGTYGPSNLPLIYAALMDDYTGGCSAGCGGDPTPFDVQTDVASHELVEAVTDPDIGLDLANNYAAPCGWGDNNNGCGEIGDICDSASAGDTITVNGRTWYVQELWSNAQGKCTSTGPASSVCVGSVTPGCRRCSCGDDGAACNGTTPTCDTGSGVCVATGTMDAGGDGATSDAGASDGSSTEDAGSDAPGDVEVEAATDSGATMDSGATPDSGSGSDSGRATDSGSGSGSASSSGATIDSGSSSDATADAEGDAGGATPGQSSGCGCRAAGADDATWSPPLVALAGLGIVAASRGKRSRRKTASKVSS